MQLNDKAHNEEFNSSSGNISNNFQQAPSVLVPTQSMRTKKPPKHSFLNGEEDEDEGFHDASSLSVDHIESNRFSSDNDDRSPSPPLVNHLYDDQQLLFQPSSLSSRFQSKLHSLLPSANPLLDKSYPIIPDVPAESLLQLTSKQILKTLHEPGDLYGQTSNPPFRNHLQQLFKQIVKFDCCLFTNSFQMTKNGFLDELKAKDKQKNSHFQTLYEKYFSSSAASIYRLVYSKYPELNNEPNDIAAYFINLKEQFGVKPTGSTIPVLKQQSLLPSVDSLQYLKQLHRLQYVKQNKPDQQQQLQQSSEKTAKLTFDSKFESGNLMFAFEKIDGRTVLSNTIEYDLLICNDINSKGYAQWFYFSIANLKVDTNLRFNIVNHSKKTSLFKSGMKPAVFSVMKNTGWERAGQNIRFYENDILKDPNRSDTYSSLSFSFLPEFEGDTVYFAMTLPYTYSEMLDHIDNLISNTASNNATQSANEKIYIKKESLCESIAGYSVPLVTITNGNDSTDKPSTATTNKPSKSTESNVITKKIAIILARQHPGETVSSFLMEGLLEFLASPTSAEAAYLRSKYIFKILPMLNPDGVVFGNFRCNLSGTDLNRQWTTPHKLLHPCVFNTKKLMHRCLESGHEIDYFIDLHGHSKKLNSFVYACKLESDVMAAQIFPMMLAKINPIYHFPSCTFGLESYKENTARGIAWISGVNKPNIFTIETSFFGYKDSTSSSRLPFSRLDLFNLGFDLGRTMCLYHCEIINKDNLSSKPSVAAFSKAAILLDINTAATAASSQSQTNKLNNSGSEDDIGGDGGGGGGGGGSGSDSDPLADELEVTEKIDKVLGKKIAKSIGLVIPKRTKTITARTPSSNVLHPQNGQRRISRKSFEAQQSKLLRNGVAPNLAQCLETLDPNTNQSATILNQGNNNKAPRQSVKRQMETQLLQQVNNFREKSKQYTERSLSRSNASQQHSQQAEREKETRDRVIDLEGRQFRIKNIIAMKQGGKTSNLLLKMNLNSSLRYKQTSNVLNSPTISVSGQSVNVTGRADEIALSSLVGRNANVNLNEESIGHHPHHSISKSKLDGSSSDGNDRGGGALLKILEKQCEVMANHYPVSDSIMYDSSPQKNHGLFYKSRINSASGTTSGSMGVGGGFISLQGGRSGSSSNQNSYRMHDRLYIDPENEGDSSGSGGGGGALGLGNPPSSTSIATLNAIVRQKAEAKRVHEQQEQNHNLIQNFSKILKENSKKYKCDTKILFLTRTKQSATTAVASGSGTAATITLTTQETLPKEKNSTTLAGMRDYMQNKSSSSPIGGVGGGGGTSSSNSGGSKAVVDLTKSKGQKMYQNKQLTSGSDSTTEGRGEERFATQGTERGEYGQGKPSFIGQLLRLEEQQRTLTNPQSRRESITKRQKISVEKQIHSLHLSEERNIVEEMMIVSTGVAGAGTVSSNKNKQVSTIRGNSSGGQQAKGIDSLIQMDFTQRNKLTQSALDKNNFTPIPTQLSFQQRNVQKYSASSQQTKLQ